ncbi:MAG: hypothetical protein ACLFVQ_02440 [Chitinispirillaceae bacterium]
MQPIRFMIDVFVSPASAAAWLILFVSFLLIVAIPAIIVGLRPPRAQFTGLGLALTPFLIGIAGMFYSLRIAFDAIDQIPEAHQLPAKATGISISMSSAFFGSIPSAVLWAIALLTILVSNNLQKSGTPPVSKRAQNWLYTIGLSGIPMIGTITVWLYGKIISYDALANVPAAQRQAASANGDLLSKQAVIVWIVLLLLIPVLYFALSRRVASKQSVTTETQS